MERLLAQMKAIQERMNLLQEKIISKTETNLERMEP
jgi:hypothetical protein